MSAIFEGSYLGDASKLADDTRLECGICWTVYDPAEGDDYWQIPPRTPFAKLPDHWRCPNCDAEKDKFMVLGTAQAFSAETVTAEPALPATPHADARVAALKAAYLAADERMLGLDVHNPRLTVDAVGFRPHGAGSGLIGVIATPWMMNIVILPDPAAPVPQPLSTREHVFPSGRYPFLASGLEGVGAIESCSLFSPMDEFDDPAVVRLVAEAAIEGLFQAEEEEAPAEPEPTPLFDTIRAAEREAEARRLATPPPQASRRAFLTGGGGGDRAPSPGS